MKYFFPYLRVIIILLFLGILVVKPTPVLAANVTVSGKVTNSLGQGVSGVSVQLTSGQTFTGSNGNYSLATIAGYNELDISNGHAGSNQGLPTSFSLVSYVTINNDTTLDITLPTNSLVVTVIDTNNSPVSGLIVNIGTQPTTFDMSTSFGPIQATAYMSTSQISEQSGVYTLMVFPNSSPGYTVGTSVPEGSLYLSENATGVMVTGDTSVTITLPFGLRVSGRITNSLGQGVSGVLVQLSAGQSHTDSNGNYSLSTTSGNNEINLTDRNAGNQSLPTYFTMVAWIDINADTTLDITLPAKKLTVTVVDASGNPVFNPGDYVYINYVPNINDNATTFTINTSLGPIQAFTNQLLTSNVFDQAGVFKLWVFPNSTPGYTVYASAPPGGRARGTVIADDRSITINLANQPPIVGIITAPATPVQVNTSISASASFTDPQPYDWHTAIWDWGDGGNPAIGTIAESNGSGSVSGTHTYTSPGVYTITLTVKDDEDGETSTIFQYISVYNPTPQGLFSGARIFTSPIGAFPQDSSLTGKVMFGASVKYSGTTPTGKANMSFKAANLDFVSTSINSLVTSGGIATLHGSGTLNGSDGYTFLVTGLDSQSGGPAIRFQIKDSSNVVIYDSQLSMPDDATPTTAVTGQVVVH